MLAAHSSTKIIPGKVKILNGPVSGLAPNSSITSRIDVDDAAARAEERIHAIERKIRASPAAADIMVHAQFAPGISVRSTSQAKTVANVRLIALTADRVNQSIKQRRIVSEVK